MPALRNEPGIVPHIYREHKRPDLFAADGSGKQAVTLRWLWSNPDAQGAVYDSRYNRLAPWRMIKSIERLRDGRFEVRSEGYIRTMLSDSIVFVDRKFAEVTP